MGWGKTLLAGIGGFVVAGPVGAAAAAAAVAGAQKLAENKDKEEKRQQEASHNSNARDELMKQRQARIQQQKENAAKKTRQEQAQLGQAREAATEAAAKANAAKDQLIIASYAIGAAAASVDGEMTKEEKVELLLFIKEQFGTNLSENVKAKIQEYEENPPKFMKAKKEIEKCQNADPAIFRTLIEHIVHSDNDVSAEEQDFLNKWDHFFPAKQ